ncbi:MAG: hypothetical protein K0S92_170, partial [Desertimonas sp.]|nr:hypothetical protein [Desertimonas sp.]
MDTVIDLLEGAARRFGAHPALIIKPG